MAKNAKIPTRGKGFNRMCRVMFESPAYRDLSLTSRGLLDEFMHIYRPERNGTLSISTMKAAKQLNCNERTAIKAFYELVEHGFLMLTEGHYWQQRKAREWRLTFEPCNNREPTDEWERWTPEKPFPLPYKKNPRLHSVQQTAAPSTAKKGCPAVSSTVRAS